MHIDPMARLSTDKLQVFPQTSKAGLSPPYELHPSRDPGMSSPIVALIALCAPLLLTTHEARQVPSSPGTWSSDIVDSIEATAACPGGTVEGLRRHMTVSEPFDGPRDYHAATSETLPPLHGLKPGDGFHQFQRSVELPDGGFWGFGGFIVERAGCIVHAEVTSHDN